MVNQLGLEFLGRPHSGIDDTRNVAVVIKELAKNGHVFEFTSFRKQNSKYSKVWNNSGNGITVLHGDFWPLITVVFGIIVLGGELQFLV